MSCALYYLRHQRKCAASACGCRGSGKRHMCQGNDEPSSFMRGVLLFALAALGTIAIIALAALLSDTLLFAARIGLVEWRLWSMDNAHWPEVVASVSGNPVLVLALLRLSEGAPTCFLAAEVLATWARNIHIEEWRCRCISSLVAVALAGSLHWTLVVVCVSAFLRPCFPQGSSPQSPTEDMATTTCDQSLSITKSSYATRLQVLLRAKESVMFPNFASLGSVNVLGEIFSDKDVVSLADAREALNRVDKHFQVAAQSALNSMEDEASKLGRSCASTSSASAEAQARESSPVAVLADSPVVLHAGDDAKRTSSVHNILSHSPDGAAPASLLCLSTHSSGSQALQNNTSADSPFVYHADDDVEVGEDAQEFFCDGDEPDIMSDDDVSTSMSWLVDSDAESNARVDAVTEGSGHLDPEMEFALQLSKTETHGARLQQARLEQANAMLLSEGALCDTAGHRGNVQVFPIPGDGWCFFRACLHQLKLDGISDFRVLACLALTMLAQRKEEFHAYVGDDAEMPARREALAHICDYAVSLDRLDPFDIYVLDKFEGVLTNDCSMERRYADQLEIKTLLEVCNLSVVIYHSTDLAMRRVMPQDQPFDEAARAALADGAIEFLLVHYVDGAYMHYDSVRFVDGTLWQVAEDTRKRVSEILQNCPTWDALCQGATAWPMARALLLSILLPGRAADADSAAAGPPLKFWGGKLFYL
jgi:hypothetical protein